MKMWTIAMFGTMLAAGSVSAQMVISAKSGLVHYVEGRVLLGDEEVVVRNGGRLTEMKPEQVLRTEEGRAEILLTPGVVLRVAEGSSVKMIANQLEDTRVELLTGTANVEATEMSKEHGVTLLTGGAAVSLRKTALIGLNAKSGIRIYKGEAQVMASGQPQIIKEGREMLFDGSFTIAKFDKNASDDLYVWANRRSEYIAMANVSAANMVRQSSGFSSYGASSWVYNPYYGMYTYLPYNSMYNSPFGYSYYSPMLVTTYFRNYAQAMNPVQPIWGGGGANNGFGAPRFDSSLGYNVNSRGGMNAGGIAPVGGSAPAAAPAASRGADAGSMGRGSAGGGGRAK